MIPLPRSATSASALLYGLLPILLALLNPPMTGFNATSVIAIALYVIAIIPSVTAYSSLRIPVAQAFLNFTICILVPLILLPQISVQQAGSFATWFVGALSTLMAATAFRQQPVIAVLGTFTLIVQLLVWGGLDVLANTGIFGAIIYVAAGWLMGAGLQKVYQDTEAHNIETIRVAADSAFKTASRAEHQRRINKALRKARPLLREIANSKGQLTEQQRAQAQQLEASLRDDIRGQDLISPEIHKAVAAARQRGVEVTLLDEGGLIGVSKADRKRILRTVAKGISKVATGRVIVRAPQGEDWNVTLMATRSGVATPDIWLKIK